jgi:NADH-quinone oxidoreductase subunit J
MSGPVTWLFLIFSVLGLASAVFTISARNPFRASLGLLGHISALAGLFVTLHAELVALVQLVIYAGALVVLFLFAMLSIGPLSALVGSRSFSPWKIGSAVAMTVFGSGFAYLLVGYHPALPAFERCRGDACQGLGGISQLVAFLFEYEYLSFALILALLTVAAVGTMALSADRRDLSNRPSATPVARSPILPIGPMETAEPPDGSL